MRITAIHSNVVFIFALPTFVVLTIEAFVVRHGHHDDGAGGGGGKVGSGCGGGGPVGVVAGIVVAVAAVVGAATVLAAADVEREGTFVIDNSYRRPWV